MRSNMTVEADDWFWSRVQRENPADCWLWQGTVHHTGYGVVQWGNKQHRTHRVAYILTYWLPDLDVLHRCGNRLCVNPAHLYEGDDVQNAADRERHGRTARYNGATKLTRSQVDEIRASTRPAREVAVAYGVSLTHIYRLRRGEEWV